MRGLVSLQQTSLLKLFGSPDFLTIVKGWNRAHPFGRVSEVIMVKEMGDEYLFPKIELDSDEILNYISNLSFDKAVSDSLFRFRCKALIALWCEGVGGLFEVLDDYIIE